MPIIPEELAVMQPLWGKWKIGRCLGYNEWGEDYELISLPEYGTEQARLHRIEAVFRQGQGQLIPVDHENREVDYLSQLAGHPNILNMKKWDIYQRKKTDGYEIHVCFPLFPAFSEWVRRGVDTEKYALDMAMDIAAALMACEQIGICHRGLTPAHLYVANKGKLFLLGNFENAGNDSRHVRGNPMYQAPEILMGKPYSVQSDLYALGMILYQCLNHGHSIYADSGTAWGIIEPPDARQLRMNGTVPFETPGAASSEMTEVVRKLLAYYPQQRFSSARELWDSLNRINHYRRDSTEWKPQSLTSESGGTLTSTSILQKAIIQKMSLGTAENGSGSLKYDDRIDNRIPEGKDRYRSEDDFHGFNQDEGHAPVNKSGSQAEKDSVHQKKYAVNQDIQPDGTVSTSLQDLDRDIGRGVSDDKAALNQPDSSVRENQTTSGRTVASSQKQSVLHPESSCSSSTGVMSRNQSQKVYVGKTYRQSTQISGMVPGRAEGKTAQKTDAMGQKRPPSGGQSMQTRSSVAHQTNGNVLYPNSGDTEQYKGEGNSLRRYATGSEKTRATIYDRNRPGLNRTGTYATEQKHIPANPEISRRRKNTVPAVNQGTAPWDTGTEKTVSQEKEAKQKTENEDSFNRTYAVYMDTDSLNHHKEAAEGQFSDSDREVRMINERAGQSFHAVKDEAGKQKTGTNILFRIMIVLLIILFVLMLFLLILSIHPSILSVSN